MASPSESPTKTPRASPLASPSESPSASLTETPKGKVKGVMFEDTNGNGIQDEGKPGIKGVDVVITNSSGTSQTLTTDSTGMSMVAVLVGPIVIDIVETTLPPGSIQTAGTDPTTVIIPASGTATDSNGFQPTGKVKGVVFEDTNGNGVQDEGKPGIEGVDMVTTDSSGTMQTLTTNLTGMYMAWVPVGPTVIDIVKSMLPPGSIQTACTDPTTVIVPAGGTATNSDGFQPAGKVKGVVFEDTNGKLCSG